MTVPHGASARLLQALLLAGLLAGAPPAVADSASDGEVRTSLAQPLDGGGEASLPEWAVAFQRAVQACWMVDPAHGSGRATVTLGFDLDREGRVVADSLSLLRAASGDADDVQAAYDSARRAVLRCQTATGDGYDLPLEVYDRWRRVELTFDPSQTGLR